MNVVEQLQKAYDIIFDLAYNVKECPEYFHDGFYEEIIDDCENVMDILNDVFTFYKA